MSFTVCLSYFACYALKENQKDKDQLVLINQIPYATTFVLLLIDGVLKRKKVWDKQLLSINNGVQQDYHELKSSMHVIFVPILFLVSDFIPKPNDPGLSLAIEIFPWYFIWYCKNIFYVFRGSATNNQDGPGVTLIDPTCSNEGGDNQQGFTILDLNAQLVSCLIIESIFYCLMTNNLAGSDSIYQVLVMVSAIMLSNVVSPVLNSKVKCFLDQCNSVIHAGPKSNKDLSVDTRVAVL